MKIKTKLETYKAPVLYTGSSMIKMLTVMVSGFIVAKYIVPEDLGKWAVVNLALTYSVFFQAGLIQGLNLELPYAYGRSDNETAIKMAGVVQTFTVCISIFVLIIGVLLFLCLHDVEQKIKNGILAVSMLIALTFYQNYLSSTFRSNHSFFKLSVVQLLDACVNIISLVLVAYYAFNGMIIRAVLIMFVSVFLLHICRPIKVAFLWDKITFLKLFKVGVFIFGLAYLQSISLTSDKLWIMKYSTMTNVGLYTFALYSFSLFVSFSASISGYIYPRMTYDYGRTGNRTHLWNKVKKITIILAVIQFPLAVGGIFLLPFFVTYLFPNYVLAIKTMQILLIAGYFRGCSVGTNALTSTRSWRYLSVQIIIYAVTMFLLTFIGIKFTENIIEGVALGVLIANVINTIVSLLIIYKALNK